MKAWVNDLNTTNFRIVISILLAVFEVVVLTLGVTLVHWEPTAMQFKVLVGVGGGTLTMMGFDVLQFVGKRFSDADYAAAKNSALPPLAQVADPATSASAPVAPGTEDQLCRGNQPAAVLTQPVAARTRVASGDGERGEGLF